VENAGVDKVWKGVILSRISKLRRRRPSSEKMLSESQSDAYADDGDDDENT